MPRAARSSRGWQQLPTYCDAGPHLAEHDIELRSIGYAWQLGGPNGCAEVGIAMLAAKTERWMTSGSKIRRAAGTLGLGRPRRSSGARIRRGLSPRIRMIAAIEQRQPAILHVAERCLPNTDRFIRKTAKTLQSVQSPGSSPEGPPTRLFWKFAASSSQKSRTSFRKSKSERLIRIRPRCISSNSREDFVRDRVGAPRSVSNCAKSCTR